VKPYFEDASVTLYHGDALAVARELPSGSVDCICTSPPYFGLRDYGIEGQYGLESSPAEYVETMRALFSELRRVLADDGTLWLNLGDSYSGGSRTSYDIKGGNTRAQGHAAQRSASGLPGKNLLGIPWMVAFALRGDGWVLRSEVIWAKTNSMPESVTDRPSGSHEHLFLLVKSARNWFDKDAIQDRGDVWELPTQPFPGAHFAVMAPALAERCVMAGCKPGGVVLDPFSGSGTTGLAAAKHGRRYIGIDLNAEYLDLSLRTRLQQGAFDFGEPA
jgi:site-specific DNA-methyltransferase (cytosine-N4-specific)